jgi:hypothetical protein
VSYSTLKVVDANGDVVPYRQYRNAWGWTPRVWMAMCERYGIRDQYGYTSSDAWQELWRRVHKAKDVSIEPFEDDVLLSTYDNAVIQQKDFARYAESLEKFAAKHPVPERVDHLAAIAKDVRGMPTDALGLCWWCTSVAEDPWVLFEAVPTADDPEDGEYRPYSLAKDTGHWIVEFA